MRKFISPLLVVLILLDLVYISVIFPRPDMWSHFMHGAAYVDPEGLLRRIGAVWASFALFHFIALIKWRQHPHWLMIVAGMRFSEIFADWTYVYYAHDMTHLGRLGLLSAGPVNLLCALFFFKAYFLVKQT